MNCVRTLTNDQTGGSTEAQSQFIDSITPKPLPQNAPRPYERQQRRRPEVANRYGLGYTYQDVLDVDEDGMTIVSMQYVQRLT